MQVNGSVGICSLQRTSIYQNGLIKIDAVLHECSVISPVPKRSFAVHYFFSPSIKNNKFLRNKLTTFYKNWSKYIVQIISIWCKCIWERNVTVKTLNYSYIYRIGIEAARITIKGSENRARYIGLFFKS